MLGLAFTRRIDKSVGSGGWRMMYGDWASSLRFPKRLKLGDYLFLATLLWISFATFLETTSVLYLLSVLFFAFTLKVRDWQKMPAAILIFFLYVAAPFYPSLVWQIPTAAFLVPLTLTLALILAVPQLRKNLMWIRLGEIDPVTAILVVSTGLISAIALVFWAIWTDYLGIGAAMMEDYQHIPRWFLLLLGIPFFSFINAFAEEMVYRGVLQTALEESFPENPAFVIVLQATAFAAAHFAVGFPNGVWGYLMTFLYALVLGYLKFRSRGMLAPYLTHVIADFVIGITLFLLVT